MTIAIAMNQDRPAGHFMKAEHFALFDDDGQVLAQFTNPRETEGCGAKNALIAMLKANQVTRVVTRHIGEHALAGLLAAGVDVYQLTNGRLNPVQWLSPAYWQPLTDASQGRPALQQMKQQKTTTTERSLSFGIWERLWCARPQFRSSTSRVW